MGENSEMDGITAKKKRNAKRTPGELKACQVNVNLTEREVQALDRAAQVKGMSRAAFARAVLLGEIRIKLVEKPPVPCDTMTSNGDTAQ